MRFLVPEGRPRSFGGARSARFVLFFPTLLSRWLPTRPDVFVEGSLTSANPFSPLLFLRWISFLTNQQESTLSFLPLVIPSDLPGSSKGKKAKGGATPTSTAPRPIVESETWTPFLTVECRGLETVGFEWEVRFSSFLCSLPRDASSP